MLIEEIEDIEACAREGRAPRPHGPYAVKIGGPDMVFERYRIDDPIVTGRQLLNLAGARPVEEHLIFMVLRGGEFEELRLEETVDLRARGVERFITFDSSASYRLVIDGQRFEWGARLITGFKLKKIAGVDPEANGVWLERTDQPDLLVENEDTVDLAEDGVERFRTGPIFSLCIEDKVFPWPRSTITTEEIAQVGGWDPSLGVIEVDQDQNERTLSPVEVIELKPGVSYGKKLCWKRGQ